MSENNQNNEIIFYNTPNGSVKVAVLIQGETLWLSQAKLALLFGVQRPAITKHLKNIFDSGELIENAVCSKMEHTADDGKVMYMKNWIDKLDAFLQFNEKEVLQNVGKISNELAIEKAEKEFEKYKAIESKNYESDFDKMLKGNKHLK